PPHRSALSLHDALPIFEALDALTPLAPLHQPRCLSPIRTIKSLRPGLKQIACFDTAFHHGLAPPVSRFAIPRRFEEMGIRRYGRSEEHTSELQAPYDLV